MKSDFNTSRLSDLAPGSEAVVVDVDAEDAAGRRLQDLGVLPQTRVLVLRRAPLGDPTLYELRGYRLCLRRHDAERVRVRPAESDGNAGDAPTGQQTSH